MPDCVTVARQTLTLFVWVQILVRQPFYGKSELMLTPIGDGFGFVFFLKDFPANQRKHCVLCDLFLFLCFFIFSFKWFSTIKSRLLFAISIAFWFAFL